MISTIEVEIINSGMALSKHLQIQRNRQRTIGFVPTMGALHQGHLELIKKSKEYSDYTIVSIFVNPTQFNNNEDFIKYPKKLDEDLKLLHNYKVDTVFIPENEEIYPQKPLISLDFGNLEHVLEGAFRPGHFNGVGIVVSKLLNLVKPHFSFFGRKDLQQVAIIKCLVNDLFFDTKVITVPTVREADGLAMSSRNERLGPEERKASVIIYRSLLFAKNELKQGKDWLMTKTKVMEMFDQDSHATLEYFEMVRDSDFSILYDVQEGQEISICVAAFIGEVRLIDNISIFD